MYLSLLVAYLIFNLFSNSKSPLCSSVLKESLQMSSQISYISSFSYSDLYSGSLFSIHFFLQNKNFQDKIHCSSYARLKVFVWFAVAWEFCDGHIHLVLGGSYHTRWDFPCPQPFVIHKAQLPRALLVIFCGKVCNSLQVLSRLEPLLV